MSLTGNTEVKNNLVGDIHIIKTINGYSAYEIAVQNGFEGTVEEWLESLKVKGDPGTMELFGELDAKGKRIMNVADPEEDGDAVNLMYLKRFTETVKVDLTDSGRDIDKITEDGFYCGKNVENSPFEYMYLEVVSCSMGSGETCCFQRLTDCQNGMTAIRCASLIADGFTGIEWEYDNPPLETISTYLTSEKFDGKDVYISQLFAGPVGKNSKNFSFQIADEEVTVISLECNFKEINTNKFYKCPLIDDSGAILASCSWDDRIIYLNAFNNTESQFMAQITVKYTLN